MLYRSHHFIVCWWYWLKSWTLMLTGMKTSYTVDEVAQINSGAHWQSWPRYIDKPTRHTKLDHNSLANAKNLAQDFISILVDQLLSVSRLRIPNKIWSGQMDWPWRRVNIQDKWTGPSLTSISWTGKGTNLKMSTTSVPTQHEMPDQKRKKHEITLSKCENHSSTSILPSI